MTVAVDERRCAICGVALNGRRPDARYCGAACRREACRIRRLVDGLPDAGYRTLGEYLAGRQRRAKRAWSGKQ